jgi:hypothetical protein
MLSLNPAYNSQGKSKFIILSLLMESRVQTDCWQTSWIDHTFIVLQITDNDPFVHICPVALYRDDWIQDNNGLSISTSTQFSRNCWQTSWIDLAFYSSSDNSQGKQPFIFNLFPLMKSLSIWNGHNGLHLSTSIESSPGRLLTNLLDWSHILLFFRLLIMIYLFSWGALYLDDWRQILQLSRVQTDCWQTPWIDLAFYSSSDDWFPR